MSPTVEAENHQSQEMFAPFQIRNDGEMTYIVAEGARNDAQTDATPGQAHYTITASAPTIQLYGVLNLRDELTDSFFIKVEGLSDVWTMENGRTTNGFQELPLGSWANAQPGQTYTIKLLRRESGAMIDSLRVEGAMFGTAAPIDPPENPFAEGKILYEQQCSACHGINGEGANAEGLIGCNFCNNVTQLASKIETSMPLSDPALCGADCAAKVADYVMAQFNAPEPSGPIEPLKARAWLLNASEYKATLTRLFGLPANYDWMDGYVDVVKEDGYPTNASKGSVSQTMALYFLEQSEAIVNGLTAAQVGSLSPCPIDQANCITEFTRDFARRAFRRDITNAQADRYLEFTVGATGISQYHQVMIGILNSPFFLYRTEMGSNENVLEGETTTLTGFEIANMVSYVLTGNPPTEDLMRAARNGELNSINSLRTIVNEMAVQPEVAQRLHRFIRAWLLVDEGKWAEIEHNDAVCSGFDDAKDSIESEFTQFLSANATVNNTLADLFTAQLPEPAGELREFYLSGNDPEGLGPVRQGILSSGIFAARHAQYSIPSPVIRGKIMRERIVCGELKGDIPVIPDLPTPGSDPNIITNRDVFNAHLAEGCVSCHELMDPLGFTMEHLDACGRYRSVDNGADVDVTGEIIATSFDTHVSDLTELSNVFADQRDIQECFASNAYQYYLGTSKEETPAALVDLVADSLGADGRLRDVLVHLLTSENILIRKR